MYLNWSVLFISNIVISLYLEPSYGSSISIETALIIENISFIFIMKSTNGKIFRVTGPL